MPTTLVMEEVRRIVGEGKNVLLPVAGRSMLPFIVGDCDRAELHPIKKPIAKGDAESRIYYILHRHRCAHADALPFRPFATEQHE